MDDEESSVFVEQSDSHRKNPYVDIITECLQHSLSLHKHLLDKNCLELIDSFSSLSPISQNLFSKLSLRKNKWHRHDRLPASKYDSPEMLDLREVLEQGNSEKIIVGLSETTHTFEEAWEAVTECLFLEEIRLLSEYVCKSKAKGLV